MIIGIKYVLTCFGSIGFEYAYKGITVINACNRNPHAGYDFTHNPKNIKQFDKIILNLKKFTLKPSKKEIIEFFYMRRFHLKINWLLINTKKISAGFGWKKDIYRPKMYDNWVSSFNINRHRNIIKTCEYFKEDINTKIRNAIQPGRQIFTTKEISNDLSKDFQFAFLTGSKRKRDEHRCTSIPYNELTNIFHKIELLNSRLDIVNTLSTFFIRVWKNDNNLSNNNNTLPSDNLLQIVYLTCNKLAPQFKNIETGVGNGLIKKAIYEAFHTCIDDNMDEINEMFENQVAALDACSAAI